MIVGTAVQNRFAQGSARVNGNAPGIEMQITGRRPFRRVELRNPTLLVGGQRLVIDMSVADERVLIESHG
jgi:hypothetical protein